MNTFWNTIAQYNAATWPIQILLVIAAVVVLYLPVSYTHLTLPTTERV